MKLDKLIKKNLPAAGLLALLLAGTAALLAVDRGADLRTALWACQHWDRLLEMSGKYPPRPARFFADGLARAKADLRSLFDDNPSRLPEIDLLITPSDLRRIEAVTRALGEKGSLRGEAKNWFPLTMLHEGDAYSARIRVRGNQSVHWLNKKKSWRIKFNKEELFQRRRSIDLIIPKDKFLEVEPAAYAVARRHGLLVPDCGFALVRQNHLDMGIYFWMEAMDKTFLERAARPEGEIFSNDDLWLDKLDVLVQENSEKLALNPAAYKTAVHAGGEIALAAQKRWTDFLALLASRNANKIDAGIEDYLDLSKFAAWHSLIYIFGSGHALSTANLKWFYDPTTGLFEPLLNDVQLYADSPATIDAQNKNPVLEAVLLSRKAVALRNKTLYRLVTEEKNDILRMLTETYRRIEPYLYRGVEPVDAQLPGVGFFSLDHLHGSHQGRRERLSSNMDDIRDWLSGARVLVRTDFNASGPRAQLSLKVLPQGLGQVLLTGLEVRPIVRFPEGRHPIRFQIVPPGGPPRPLAVSGGEMSHDKLRFAFPQVPMGLPLENGAAGAKENTWTILLLLGNAGEFSRTQAMPSAVKLEFINAATGLPVPEHLVRAAPVVADIPTGTVFRDEKNDAVPDVGKPSDPEERSGIARLIAASGLPLRRDGRVLRLPPGTHALHRDLVLPRGYGLTLDAGARLRIAPNRNIVLYEALQLRGTRAAPVTIERLDPGSAWGTIGVLKAARKSLLKRAVIRGGGAGTKTIFQGVYFTGQLNFYGSNVDIADSEISDSEGEDALNIKNARFRLENVLFARNRADAFDGDWVRGEVLACRFLDNGNDGLDFSGAEVKVEESGFSGMGDKAISGGEQSRIEVKNGSVERSRYGIVAKDLSLIRVRGTRVVGNDVGLSAYRKKPVFGGGTIEMAGGELGGNKENIQADPVSKVKRLEAGAP